MKNILLLGNGFDMRYNLPTKYVDFLHVVIFLQDHQGETFNTIGDVFSQQALQETDEFIKACYNAHSQTYNSTPLEQDTVAEIISLTEKNLWFLYLRKVFDKDAGWIDFEKEIGYALKCFERIFEKKMVFQFHEDENHIRYVVALFGFLIQRLIANRVTAPGTYTISSEYLLEKPIGSKKYEIDKNKIVDKLFEELASLVKALRIYFQCFVESTYALLSKEETCDRMDFFSFMDKAITFNYTHTYEALYFKDDVFHIHGDTNNEIVLGINSDEADDLSSVDTTFVRFKKYYQRTFFETDREYLLWMNELINTKTSYRLFAMGHSLDITDKDIIQELFENAEEIVILYHDSNAKGSYIANLIKLFGKSGFDALKKEKKLTFLSLNSDLSSVKELLSNESWQALQVMVFSQEGEKITPM